MQRTIAERFWSKVVKTSTCWAWSGSRFAKGYGRFYDRKIRLAHRVAWELAHGPIPVGCGVLHRCDNRACVNVERCLFLGTQADNMADMKAKGRGRGESRPGEASPMAKLNWVTADEIRTAPQSLTNKQLAIKHNIDAAQISRIRSGLAWVRGG